MIIRRNAILSILLLTAMIAGCNPGGATSTATPTSGLSPLESAEQTAIAEDEAEQAKTVFYSSLPAPEGAQARLGIGVYTDLDLSPDGELLAVASSAAVTMYSTKDFSQKWVHAPDRSPARIVYAPDGKTVAYLDRGTVVFLDAQDGAVQRTIEIPVAYFTGFEISPDGRQLAVTGRDMPPTILDALTGEVVKQFEVNEKAAQVIGSAPDTRAHTGYDLYDTAVAWSPDGKTLAVGRSLTGLLFFDIATGASKIIPLPDIGVAEIAYSPDGRLVATSPYGSDGTVRVWDASSGDLQWESKSEAIYESQNLAFSPDGKHLAIGSDYGGTRLMDSVSGAQVWETYTGTVRGFAFSPDGQVLYSGYRDGVLAVNTRDGTFRAGLAGFTQEIEDAAIEPDLSTIYLAMGNFYRWKRNSGTEYAMELMAGTYGSLADSVPGSELLASAGFGSNNGEAQSTVHVQDPSSGTRPRKLGDFPQIQTIELSPDGKSLALGTFSGHMILLDTQDGNRRLDLTLSAEGAGDPPGVTDIAFAPDGRTLVFVSSFSKELALWDAATGEKRPLVDITNSAWSGYSDAAFSADGKFLAIRSDRNAIAVFDLSTGKSFRSLAETCESGGLNQTRSRRMAYRPDGILAVGCEDGMLELYSADGALLEARKGHTGSVVAVRWAEDGKTLVSASQDGTVIIWNPLDAGVPAPGETAQPAAGVTMREIRMERMIDYADIEIGVEWYLEVTNNNNDWISGAPDLNITLYDETGDVLIQDDLSTDSRYPIPPHESILTIYRYNYPAQVEESGFTIGAYDLFLDPPFPWEGISSNLHPKIGTPRVPWLELTFVQAGIRDIGWGSKEFAGTVRNDNAETCYKPIIFGYLYYKPDTYIEDLYAEAGDRKALAPGEAFFEIPSGKTLPFADSIYNELKKPNVAYKVWGLCLGK